jgi:galactokinase/mevalonate kinase-like predicted kinase
MAKKKEDFYDIFKKIARKTEDVIDDQVEKLNKSGAIDKMDNYITQTGDFVAKKIDQFQKSDIPDKVDDFVDKTEQKTREMSDKMSKKAEDLIDGFKTRSGTKENQPSKEEESNHPKPTD